MRVLQITATATVASACAGPAGLGNTVTAQPAQTRVSLKTECCAAGAGTAFAASVFAQTPEPPDPPVNDVLPAVTPVTQSGNVSVALVPFVENVPHDQSSKDILSTQTSDCLRRVWFPGIHQNTNPRGPCDPQPGTAVSLGLEAFSVLIIQNHKVTFLPETAGGSGADVPH